MTTHKNNSATKDNRIIGYDLARAFAIIGMVFVNFRMALMVIGVNVSSDGLGGEIADWTSGRAAATFVILAGVGISLLTKRAVEDSKFRVKCRWRLLRRSIFFTAIGWPFLVVWEGDILHYYAAYFFIGAFVFHWRPRFLLLASCVLMLSVFPLLEVWEKNWAFETLTYNNLWTIQGQFLNLFVNGFHPLLPWLAFLLIGIALGRILQERPELSAKIAFGAGAIAICTEAVSRYFVSKALEEGIEASIAKATYGTSTIPPLPQYILAASGFAVAFICLCRFIGTLANGKGSILRIVLHPILCLGRMALTIYVLHVFLGVFPVYMHATENIQSWGLSECTLATVAFSLLAMLMTTMWQKFIGHGPAELLMRNFSDRKGKKSWGALAVASLCMGTLVILVALNNESSQAKLPDEAEYTARCTRWILYNPLTNLFSYEDWAAENFGSDKKFENEWLKKMYFEYAKEKPMNDTDFSSWLTGKVRQHIQSQHIQSKHK